MLQVFIVGTAQRTQLRLLPILQRLGYQPQAIRSLKDAHKLLRQQSPALFIVPADWAAQYATQINRLGRSGQRLMLLIHGESGPPASPDLDQHMPIARVSHPILESDLQQAIKQLLDETGV